MFCKKCGTKIPDDGTFCPNCGQAVENGKEKSREYSEQAQEQPPVSGVSPSESSGNDEKIKKNAKLILIGLLIVSAILLLFSNWVYYDADWGYCTETWPLNFIFGSNSLGGNDLSKPGFLDFLVLLFVILIPYYMVIEIYITYFRKERDKSDETMTPGTICEYIFGYYLYVELFINRLLIEKLKIDEVCFNSTFYIFTAICLIMAAIIKISGLKSMEQSGDKEK